jgi:hypothetical protein
MSVRTTASKALWGHLLPNGAMTPRVSDNLPPIAPLDKTGTSMRLLLHDTQANLEKFSERVDKLTTGVQATKDEMDAIKNLWDVENEKAHGQISDLSECLALLQYSVETRTFSCTDRTRLKYSAYYCSISHQMSNVYPGLPWNACPISFHRKLVQGRFLGFPQTRYSRETGGRSADGEIIT